MSKKVKEQPDVAKRIKDLERINEEQRARIEKLERELSEATQIISGVQEERDASDEEERQQLIWKLSQDSKGYLRKDHLSMLPLHQLRLMRKTFEHESAIDYIEYFERRQRRELTGQQRTGLTVGEFEPKSKTWKAY